MQRSGIYIIINRFNNKVYIGQSVHVATRIKQHFTALRKGRHSNKEMQRDYNTYGRYFDWQLLEIVAVEHLSEREAYWCEKYHALNPKYGYNHQEIRDQIYVKDPSKYKYSTF